MQPNFIHSESQWKNTEHRTELGLNYAGNKSIFLFRTNPLNRPIRFLYRDTSTLVCHVNKTYPAAQYFNTPAVKHSLISAVIFSPKHFALNRQPPVPEQAGEWAALGIQSFYSCFCPGLGCMFTGFISHHLTTAPLSLFMC